MGKIPNELISIDPKTPIWRYYKLEFFLRLIEYKEIYIPRAIDFDDNFECYFPSVDEKRMNANYISPFEKNKNVQNAIVSSMNESINKERNNTYISCWHNNEIENMAMWRYYGNMEKVIAIKSSVERLKKNLPHFFDIYKVRYVIPGESAFKNETEALMRCMIKRAEFRFEQEIRAVTVEDALKHPNNEKRITRQEKGISIKIKNLQDFIENIYIYPKSEDSLYELMNRILKKKKINKLLKHSNLDENPYLWNTLNDK